MIEPTLLLTDLGDGPETISVFRNEFVTIEGGDWTQSNTTIVDVYPAVVTRSIASPSSVNNRMDSMVTHTIMIYADQDPKIQNLQRIEWLDPADKTKHVFQAQGSAISSGRGAYQVSAQEITGPEEAELEDETETPGWFTIPERHDVQ